ncbi:MAG: M48 family metallopeptidase [Chitinophagaceae bacterium]
MTNKLLIFSIIFLFFSSCSQVPITGRSQLDLIPESQMDAMAVTQYQTFLSQNRVISSSGSQDAAMVKRVGGRIANAVTQYLTSHGMADRVANYHWEFNLVDNKEANAWCMPGGKVVVYSGMLPITQNATALAVVLGHEISHAIARHGDERMSQALIAQGIQLAGSSVLNNSPQAQNIFLQAFGVGGQLGTLAFSRQQESEADHMGLIFMAMAGYDPRAAIPFWLKMESLGSQSSTPPVFLSDHPSDAQRIANIRRLMPQALTYYHP